MLAFTAFTEQLGNFTEVVRTTLNSGVGSSKFTYIGVDSTEVSHFSKIAITEVFEVEYISGSYFRKEVLQFTDWEKGFVTSNEHNKRLDTTELADLWGNMHEIGRLVDTRTDSVISYGARVL
jgi:hypothetical protein